ncbi:hypothetical protein PAECIP111892_03703 [Paenibacillus auburnensis]|uniref:ABC transporter permease n=1 Tax=Paenibacillus auburnensis TaxID=2905649 RepID=A0ABN8GLK0_9BACL|nr:ABC transporter permease [Paenibacillus auburnensis]CAH1212147.1 hypothetical protein PAECIP111892_03703 [Paenibacillus auburnensis]
MTGLKTLVQLEYSRYSLSRQGKYRPIVLALSLIVLLLAAGVFLPGPRASERSPFIYAVFLLWTAAIAISSLHMLMFMNQSHRDWMLSFPHSRLKLLYAKGISLLRHNLNLTFPVLAASVSLYFISVQAGWYQPLPAGGLLYMIAAYTLFIIVSLPVAVTLGLAVSLLLRAGKTALLLMMIPYTLLWILPAMIGSILSISYSGTQSLKFTAPGYVLCAALALCLIGWPLCYQLMRLIAAKGLSVPSGTGRSSAALTSGRPGFASKRSNRSSSLTGRTAPFIILYRLCIRRVHRIERHPAIVILKLALPFIIAAAAYFGSSYEAGSLAIARSLFMLPVLFGSVWMISRSSIERKHQSWWLSFPQSRLVLLLSGVAMVWVTAMRIITVLAVSAIAGSITGLITGRTTTQELSYALTWLLFSFLLFTLSLTVILCLLQAEYYLLKSPALTILMLPLALLGPLHSILINKFMIPDSLPGGALPDWSLLGWISVIALPLALCCLPAGAKYYHLSLMQPKSKASQTKQA